MPDTYIPQIYTGKERTPTRVGWTELGRHDGDEFKSYNTCGRGMDMVVISVICCVALFGIQNDP
jgi:hypothetical protein